MYACKYGRHITHAAAIAGVPHLATAPPAPSGLQDRSGRSLPTASSSSVAPHSPHPHLHPPPHLVGVSVCVCGGGGGGGVHICNMYNIIARLHAPAACAVCTCMYRSQAKLDARSFPLNSPASGNEQASRDETKAQFLIPNTENYYMLNQSVCSTYVHTVHKNSN